MKRAQINVNGINIFYRDTESDNPPMLCLHGKWGRGETWVDLMERCRNRFRIIAPDQRGHGLSEKPIARYSGEDFAKDAYGLLTSLGCTPATVVGHSIGGSNAAYLAALYPEAVKRLVILDATADGPSDLSALAPENVSPVDNFTANWPTPFPTYDAAAKFLSGIFSPETNARYFMDSLVESREGYDFLFSRYAMAAIDVYYQNCHHILKNIKSPVLLVRAQNSWYLSKGEAEKMVEEIPDCQYHEISGSDHMVYVDNKAEFYPVLNNFINSY